MLGNGLKTWRNDRPRSTIRNWDPNCVNVNAIEVKPSIYNATYNDGNLGKQITPLD